MNTLNSCLMWAINLDTPVDLGCVFDSSDLKDTGVELDSHITLLYAQGEEIPKDNLISEIHEILGDEDFEWFTGLCKNDTFYETLDLFELGTFENDSDYVVLKMKQSEVLNKLRLINKGLSVRYGVTSKFDNYVPHLTLAELQPGTAKKYIESQTLQGVLKDSAINFEDILISYGEDGVPEDRKHFYLTKYKVIPRFFRIFHLKEDSIE